MSTLYFSRKSHSLCVSLDFCFSFNPAHIEWKSVIGVQFVVLLSPYPQLFLEGTRAQFFRMSP